MKFAQTHRFCYILCTNIFFAQKNRQTNKLSLLPTTPTTTNTTFNHSHIFFLSLSHKQRILNIYYSMYRSYHYHHHHHRIQNKHQNIRLNNNQEYRNYHHMYSSVYVSSKCTTKKKKQTLHVPDISR